MLTKKIFIIAGEISGDQIGMLVLACEVTFGSSGAPVIYKYPDGRFTIVSLISAKAQLNGQES